MHLNINRSYSLIADFPRLGRGNLYYPNLPSKSYRTFATLSLAFLLSEHTAGPR